MLQELPHLKRKSDVKSFLSTYCSRGRDVTANSEGAKSQEKQKSMNSASVEMKQRQLVNIEKVLEANLVAAEPGESEKPEELKARVSRKLQDVMTARLSLERAAQQDASPRKEA